jgi:hypothetical protein
VSAPPNSRLPRLLTGHECVDVNRWTGVPMSARQRKKWHEPDTHFGAVDQGVIGIDEVFIDLDRLSYWDAMKVAWCRIGASFYIDSMLDYKHRAQETGENPWWFSDCWRSGSFSSLQAG